MESSLEHKTVSKVTWRLLPLLFLCYIIAYIDRINVGFAGLQLQKAFNVDAARYYEIYGWGAGMFFLGYFIFEVPSNLILHRVGARIWVARIMIVWGVISSAMMLIKSPTGFYDAIPARGSGGGLLPGNHPVSHLLVPIQGSRPYGRPLRHRGDTGRLHQLSGFRKAASTRWSLGVGRLAMAVLP